MNDLDILILECQQPIGRIHDQKGFCFFSEILKFSTKSEKERNDFPLTTTNYISEACFLFFFEQQGPVSFVGMSTSLSQSNEAPRT